eukprot:15358293-Ditylum_brightwellii.AAC.1
MVGLRPLLALENHRRVNDKSLHIPLPLYHAIKYLQKGKEEPPSYCPRRQVIALIGQRCQVQPVLLPHRIIFHPSAQMQAIVIMDGVAID